MNNKRLVALTACLILATVPGISSLILADIASETDTKAEQHFEKAKELRKAADYDDAITEYQKVMSLSPKSKIAQDAQYWIGQSYFEARQFDTALTTFQELINEFPDSMVVSTTKQMIERVQQAKKNKSLFEAVKKADVEQVKLVIAEGADIDAKWGDVYNKNEGDPLLLKKFGLNDSTPLWHAVDSNNMDEVKLLVETGADVNAGKWPPLGRAVDVNNTAIAEYLIDHGANVNYPADWGPLQESVTFSIEMVKLLLEKGADINGGTTMPALHYAVNMNLKDIVELLIQHGADINTKDQWGTTPLFWSVNNLYFYESLVDVIDIMNLLIANGADVNSKTEQGWPNIFFAADAGKTEAVKLLLEAGADISFKDDAGQTALHVAAQNGHTDVVELLLDKGADINVKDKEGRTPLHLAAESADGDIVALLLDKGVDINAKDDSGFTALHHAARLGKKNVAELLIASGADIDTKDKQGHTPLYVAVNHGYKVAELLMNKGADSSIETESGRTLLELAQERKQAESTIPVPDMIFDGESNSHFGRNIVCGDVDGDGYDDILIGAYKYNNYRGRVYLFYGGPDMDTTADLILEGQNEGDWFGIGISCGDIDNDGHDDIVIGAGRNRERRGRAYLYWGSDRNSMDANPDKIFAGEQEKGSQDMAQKMMKNS